MSADISTEYATPSTSPVSGFVSILRYIRTQMGAPASFWRTYSKLRPERPELKLSSRAGRLNRAVNSSRIWGWVMRPATPAKNSSAVSALIILRMSADMPWPSPQVFLVILSCKVPMASGFAARRVWMELRNFSRSRSEAATVSVISTMTT